MTVAAIAAGARAGVIGGLAMALCATVRSAVAGLGPWLPMKLVAASWVGVEALIGGAGVIVYGALTHLAVAAAWGILLADLVGRRRGALAVLVLGIGYALLVWLFMSYAMLPWLDPTMFHRVVPAMPWFFIDHVVFGITAAFAIRDPSRRRRASRSGCW